MILTNPQLASTISVSTAHWFYALKLSFAFSDSSKILIGCSEFLILYWCPLQVRIRRVQITFTKNKDAEKGETKKIPPAKDSTISVSWLSLCTQDKCKLLVSCVIFKAFSFFLEGAQVGVNGEWKNSERIADPAPTIDNMNLINFQFESISWHPMSRKHNDSHFEVIIHYSKYNYECYNRFLPMDPPKSVKVSWQSWQYQKIHKERFQCSLLICFVSPTFPNHTPFDLTASF